MQERETRKLEDFIEKLSNLEDADKPCEHEYLFFNEDNCIQKFCEWSVGNGECPRYCIKDCPRLISYMDDKKRLISAGNRIIHALIKKGYWIINNQVSCEPYEINYSKRGVDSNYIDYDDKGFCENCERNGTDKCPEDMLHTDCPRRHTAYAIERVTDAINELI